MVDTVFNGDDAKPLSIVLVEDDDGDAKAVQRAFAQARIINPIIRVEDGIAALQLLRGQNGFKKPAKPFIILLDLNTPRMNGHEFIAEIRKDQGLRKAIIFVLTTSKNEDDMTKAYDLNVAGYIVKETAGRDFLQLVSMIDIYWQLVELPE